MQDLNTINFKIALENKDQIDDENLTAFLNSRDGKTNKAHLFNFIAQICTRQNFIDDIQTEYSYFYELINRALKILDLEQYKDGLDIMTLAVISSIATFCGQDLLEDNFFRNKINSVIVKQANKYIDTSYDILFVCWYTCVIKVLKMALANFQKNKDLIKSLADFANENNIRMTNINFENKELMIN